MTTTTSKRLAYARFAMGVIVLLRTTPLLFFLHPRFSAETSPLLGWPNDDEWTIAAFGLALPRVLVAALCIIRTIAAVLFAGGIQTRTAGIVAFVSGYLVLAQDRFAFINSLHVLFLSTLVLALATAEETKSSSSSPSASASPSPSPSSSSVRFVSLFLASIYFWAGAAKMQSQWLSGRALEAHVRDGSFAAGALGGWIENAVLYLHHHGAGLVAVASWIVPLIELTIAILLALDRKRRIAIVLALAFHLVIELTINPDLLGWQMAVLLLAIWPVPSANGAASSRVASS